MSQDHVQNILNSEWMGDPNNRIHGPVGEFLPIYGFKVYTIGSFGLFLRLDKPVSRCGSITVDHEIWHDTFSLVSFSKYLIIDSFCPLILSLNTAIQVDTDTRVLDL